VRDGSGLIIVVIIEYIDRLKTAYVDRLKKAYVNERFENRRGQNKAVNRL
jgi:hypothetical protein